MTLFDSIDPSVSFTLYRDTDGYYNEIPSVAGFYLLIESIGDDSNTFLAIAKMGQWGSYEFHTIKDGEWINYSENIPKDAVVEFAYFDDCRVDIWGKEPCKR